MRAKITPKMLVYSNVSTRVVSMPYTVPNTLPAKEQYQNVIHTSLVITQHTMIYSMMVISRNCFALLRAILVHAGILIMAIPFTLRFSIKLLRYGEYLFQRNNFLFWFQLFCCHLFCILTLSHCWTI